MQGSLVLCLCAVIGQIDGQVPSGNPAGQYPPNQVTFPFAPGSENGQPGVNAPLTQPQDASVLLPNGGPPNRLPLEAGVPTAPIDGTGAPVVRSGGNGLRPGGQGPLMQDPAVQPASAQEPDVGVDTRHASSAPLVLKAALEGRAQATLPGRPMTLRQTLERVDDTGRQLQVINSYWRLTHAMGQYHFALDEAQFLQSLPVTRQSANEFVLQAAIEHAGASIEDARLALEGEQYELADLAMLDSATGVPLPADIPWVGRYRTNFTQLFGGRAPPVGMRRIDRTLPRFLRLIEARANAVLAANDALNTLANAYQQNQAALSQVLEAHGGLSRRRLEFLTTVRDYNLTIADYAINATGGSVNRDTMVSMLIQKSSGSSVLVPASAAPTPNLNPNSLPAQPNAAAGPNPVANGGGFQ